MSVEWPQMPKSENSSNVGLMSHCDYCRKQCDHVNEPFLTCVQCSKNIHINCLRSGGVPGGLVGDVFFKLCCLECTGGIEEIITRDKLPWLAVVTLALYFLSKKELTSNKGFFHYKHHICDFINRNYEYLFKMEGHQSKVSKKTKKWMGTVSGTLSHFHPKYFQSGSGIVLEPGWWKLTKKDVPPKVIVDEYYTTKEGAKLASSKKTKNKVASLLKLTNKDICDDDLSLNESSLDSQDLDLIDNLEQHASLTSDNDMYSRAYVEPSETLSNHLFEDELEDSNDNMDIDIVGGEMSEMHDRNFLDVRGTNDFDQRFLLEQDEMRKIDEEPQNQPGKTLPGTIKCEAEDYELDFDVDPDQDEFVHLTAVKPQLDVLDLDTIGQSESEDEDSDEDSRTPYVAPAELPKSLFNVRSETAEARPRPWENVDRPRNTASWKKNLIAISEFEESQLFEQLRRTWTSADFPCSARRLYRKLCVRRLKRQHNIAPFNIDSCDTWQPRRLKQYYQSAPGDVRILDRFQKTKARRCNEVDPESPFVVRLSGEFEPNNFFSPYTQRELKAFIWRDQITKPPWLALMEEMLAVSNKNNPDWEPEERWPIDYSYVRPQHIASVNSLCEEFFYPGIDLSEALTYPDFSCVALYKKLVVGFAFLVPDVGYNETYISFLFVRPEWRRAGVATFMLYHLIQTCMGKDITLHVSAANPAIVLYQKFGFKMEEYVQDFYDKYLPADSKECKHAVFLRLTR